jgi:hypothetical protein
MVAWRSICEDVFHSIRRSRVTHPPDEDEFEPRSLVTGASVELVYHISQINLISLSLYKITDVRLKPFKLLLWMFQPKTVGARTVPEPTRY